MEERYGSGMKNTKKITRELTVRRETKSYLRSFKCFQWSLDRSKLDD